MQQISSIPSDYFSTVLRRYIMSPSLGQEQAQASGISSTPVHDVMLQNAIPFYGGIDIQAQLNLTNYSTNNINGMIAGTPLQYSSPTGRVMANFNYSIHQIGTELDLVDAITSRTSGDNGRAFSEFYAIYTNLGLNPASKLAINGALQAQMLYDVTANFRQSYANLIVDDGSTYPNQLQGLGSLITADPTVGIVGGIDRSTAGNELWRNQVGTVTVSQASYDPADTPVSNMLNGLINDCTDYGTPYSRDPMLRAGNRWAIFAGTTIFAYLQREVTLSFLYNLQGMGNNGGVSGDRTSSASVSMPMQNNFNYQGIEVYRSLEMDNVGNTNNLYIVDLVAVRLNLYANNIPSALRGENSPSQEFARSQMLRPTQQGSYIQFFETATSSDNALGRIAGFNASAITAQQLNTCGWGAMTITA